MAKKKKYEGVEPTEDEVRRSTAIAANCSGALKLLPPQLSMVTLGGIVGHMSLQYQVTEDEFYKALRQVAHNYVKNQATN